MVVLVPAEFLSYRYRREEFPMVGYLQASPQVPGCLPVVEEAAAEGNFVGLRVVVGMAVDYY